MMRGPKFLSDSLNERTGTDEYLYRSAKASDARFMKALLTPRQFFSDNN